MKKMSSSYIGTLPVNALTNTVIDFVRDALKGTGFNISIFARNPNREQFYGKRSMSYDGKHLYKHYFAQNLPREHATSLALYVRPSEKMTRDPRRRSAEKTAVARAHLTLISALSS